MSPDQDPRSAIPPRSGGFRNRLRKFVRGRKSLPAAPGYTLPLSHPPPPSRNGHSAPVALFVHLNIQYKHPLNVNFENAYESSRSYVASDEVCHGLLRRLDHGCPELITRRDAAALTSRKGQKPMRYELTFTVNRNGKPWAVKVFTSYQELPLDSLAALEVAEDCDRLVGPFLKRHDKAFMWQPCERLDAQPDTAVAPQGNTISLVSIPLCRFSLAKQEYEFVPGYEINLLFRSQRRPRKPVLWEKNLHIKSQQNVPLTLALGEDLTWKISSTLTRMLDSRRHLRPIHTTSDDSDSDDTRAHLAEDSLHVDFRIRNRIGFDYAHLERSTESRLALFSHPQGLDCEDFMIELERAITETRDEVDKKLSLSDDLKISVRQVSGLSGTYWTVKNPFAVSLDPSISYSRNTIQAVLDRVQTGVEEVVRGSDVSISFAASKRGHVVLDKTIVAQADRSSPQRLPGKPADPDQDGLLKALKERMQRDVAMVVRDTLSLDASGKAPPNIRLTERRMDAPLPSPSTLVASSHAESEDHHHDHENPMSVDDIITASMARFAALDDNTSDSGETATRRRSTAETPARPIPLIKDEQNGTAWRSTRRESITNISFATTEEGDSASTRLSTPCFSERDADAHHDSIPTTPSLSRGASHTFERFLSKPDDSSVKSEDADDMKMPRRFALLSRRNRPQTPVVETEGDGEPMLINTMGSRSEKHAVVAEKTHRHAAEQMTKELDALVDSLEKAEEGPRARPKPILAESNGSALQPQNPAIKSGSSAPSSNGSVTPLAEPKSPQEFQGWLAYSAVHPSEDVKTPSSVDTSRQLRLGPQSPVSEAQSTPTRQNAPEHHVHTAPIPIPKSPQPQTPVMSCADSTVSESPVDPSLIPLDYDEGTTPSPTLSSTSLTLWRPYGSPLIPDEFDLNALESPSKYIRPSLHPRPQSSQTNASFFSNPMSISPTASPSPARRPYLAMHKRQFSSPTAGYLGLLHGRGSPLRMQSYVYAPHDLDAATAEEDEDASASNSPLSQMQRRSSWALVAMRTAKDVELAARPSSSAGLPAPATPEMRARSGSTLSASMWLN